MVTYHIVCQECDLAELIINFVADPTQDRVVTATRYDIYQPLICQAVEEHPDLKKLAPYQRLLYSTVEPHHIHTYHPEAQKIAPHLRSLLTVLTSSLHMESIAIPTP